MLWTLIKIAFFVAFIAAAAWAAGWLLEAEGGVQVAVADTEFTLGPLASIIALIVLVIAVWLLLALLGLVFAVLRFLAGDETAIRRWRSARRERKGYEALTDSLVALASGDGRTAMTNAERADRYLDRPELTRLLTAQAAEQAGDRARAEAAYHELIESDRTRFVGIRGIMRQKLEDGDTETAMALAERAFALKPRHEETQDLLLKLQANNHDWQAARKTLGAKLRHGSLPRDLHKRRDAVLALGAARDIVDEGKDIEAREKAIEANRLSPDLIPAAVMAADAFVAEGRPKYAARILKKAWAAEPHPDLAAAFARIAPDETAEERLKRFGTLTAVKPDHPETRMLQAELLIAAEDFPAARKALGDLVETAPTQRVMTIMAAIERGTGADDAVVKGWLARALTAPRGPRWVCDNCRAVHADWQPVCDRCDAFDTLSWRKPADDEAELPAGAEMLPLIVGSIAGPDREPEAEKDDMPPNEGVIDVGPEAEDDGPGEPPLDYERPDETRGREAS